MPDFSRLLPVDSLREAEMRVRYVVRLAVIIGMTFAPGVAYAAQIPASQPMAATISTTYIPAQAKYVSSFSSPTAGANVFVRNQHENVTVDDFHMTDGAQSCCGIHTFSVGPWSGTWNANGRDGDTLSGTAAGNIDTGCLQDPTQEVDPFCEVGYFGPGVNFTLTITGGTGRYAGATGTGSLTGEQT